MPSFRFGNIKETDKHFTHRLIILIKRAKICTWKQSY